MRVSHSELYAVCKKVFEGLGFPHGVDEDAAFMVSWVELHGLEGLDRLRIALPALLADRSPARLELLSEDSHSAVIDARGASALAVSPAAIDMASALAAEDRPAHVELRNCGDEIFAVAPAVRASELRGQRFEIRWSGGGEDYVFAGRDRNSSCLNVRSGGSGQVVDRAGLSIRCACADFD
ncbi:MAG: DUF3726 domain-containing protein, partial [Gammaproteobacteria bacterium]